MSTRYVSSLAGGAGTGTLASPWTLGQISAGYAAVDEIRIMADGIYPLTAVVTLGLTSTAGSTLITGANASGVVDGSRPTLKWVTNPGAATYAFNPSVAGHRFELLAFDGNNTSNGRIITCTSSGNAEIYDCTFSNFASGSTIGGASVTGFGVLEKCTFSGNSANLIATSGWLRRITRCVFKNHTANRLGDDLAQCVDQNVFYNFSIAPLRLAGACQTFENNTIHTVTADGLIMFGDVAGVVVRNNIIWNCTGTGMNGASAAIQNWPSLSERRARIEANAIGGIAGVNYGTDIGRVISTIALSGDPCNNAAAGDFTLNNTAGAGAACRGAGVPAYRDIGALQHQDTGGAGTGGGMRIYGG